MHVRTRRGRAALTAALTAVALLGTSAPAWATNGTIRVLKGGDRVAGSTDNREYAADLSGALFEYTASAAKAADPASTGWTAFPSATNASGAATVTVAAGTYYVRERSPSAPSFDAFGAAQALAYDGGDNTPSSPAPYVAKVVVQVGQTTEAFPNTNRSGDTANWTSTSPGASGSPFVDVRDNPPFPEICGINILLVLDRSGSIAGHEDDYRDAAKAFVDSLAGTPTQIGILSFSAGATPVNSYQGGLGSAALTHAPADLTASGSAASLDATIDDVYTNPVGGTNWDAALQAAAAAKGFAVNASTGQTGNPDVVVFLTDGNPTARSTAGSDAGAGVDLLDLTAGMASANLVKNQAARTGTKVKLFAVGVGSGVNAANLRAVSGPEPGEDYDTPTIAELRAELAELAARICSSEIDIEKSGPAFAYPGDTLTFSFTVRNTGDLTLTGVTVSDDRCSPVTGGQGTLAPGASATFTCTTQVPPGHAIGDENPLHNVATTTGTDTRGETVSDTDDHDTIVLHPAVDIEKAGPATAVAGAVLAYALTVTNPGDVPFASDQVAVTDPGCDDQPTLTGTGGDATPGSLDPGDTWKYACSHATAAGVALTYPNAATVTARDANGRQVTDTDAIETLLDAGGVAPEEVVGGTARLRGPSGCVRTAFRATVRGSRIARVTFFVDGKRVKRLTAPNGEGTRFNLKVNSRGRGFGVHRVTAKVEFAAASETRTRTLRLSFQRCRKQVVRPRFTG